MNQSLNNLSSTLENLSLNNSIDTNEDTIIKYNHVLTPSIHDLINRINILMEEEDLDKRRNLLEELMKNAQLKLRELKKYAYIEESAPYTRNLIWETDRYALILMCWKPRTDSVIHSHGGSSCWARIVNGEVRERRYLFNDDTQTPELNNDTLLEVGQVTYIDDALGLHSLCNPSGAYSMSLHLYMPPIKTAKYFEVKDKKMHKCEMIYHRKHNQSST